MWLIQRLSISTDEPWVLFMTWSMDRIQVLLNEDWDKALFVLWSCSSHDFELCLKPAKHHGKRSSIIYYYFFFLRLPILHMFTAPFNDLSLGFFFILVRDYNGITKSYCGINTNLSVLHTVYFCEILVFYSAVYRYTTGNPNPNWIVKKTLIFGIVKVIMVSY